MNCLAYQNGKKQRKTTCVFPYTALLASSSSLMFAPLFSCEQRTAPEIGLEAGVLLCSLTAFALHLAASICHA